MRTDNQPTKQQHPFVPDKYEDVDAEMTRPTAREPNDNTTLVYAVSEPEQPAALT